MPQAIDPKRIASRIIDGVGPAAIAKATGIFTREVIEQIHTAIDLSLIRQTDVLLTLEPLLANVDDYFENNYDISAKRVSQTLSIVGIEHDADELTLLLCYRQKSVHVLDTYDLLTNLERKLHRKIKSVLTKAFGKEESGWWGQGVPKAVRISCCTNRESEETPEYTDHPYNYTTLIHLKVIMESHWAYFQPLLSQQEKANRKKFLGLFDQLNRTRNRFMHPVREEPPTLDDYRFVKTTWDKFNTSAWR